MYLRIVGQVVMDVVKTQRINDNTFLGKQQEDVMHKEEDQLKEDNVQAMNDVKETRRGEEINGKVATFLHEKDLSGNLVETSSDTDVTDEYVRLDGIDKYFIYRISRISQNCNLYYL